MSSFHWKEFPHVVRIVETGVLRGDEYIICEMRDGSRYTSTLTGTSLEGWVYAYTKQYPARDGVRSAFYAEFGVNADGTHYLEPLLTSRAFDRQKAEDSSSYAYLAWKTLHLVDPGICPDVPLYYESVGVPYR